MATEILYIQFIISSVLVISLSYFFGKWKSQSVFITVAYTIGWYIPLVFIGMLPIDIALTYVIEFHTNANKTIDKSLPKQAYTLHICWYVVYWTSQALTWFILPIMQSFSNAGEFTTLKKVRAAIIDNAVYYGSYLAVFSCILIYLLVKKTVPINIEAIKVLIITTSNTWGLFLIIVFLGYGLVEVPRLSWCAGTPQTRLRLAYFQLSKRYLEYIENTADLDKVYHEIKEMDAYMPPDHGLRPHLLIIKQTATIDSSPLVGTNENEIGNYTYDGKPNRQISERNFQVPISKLVSLHKRLKKCLHHSAQSKELWIQAIRVAAWCEDVVSNMISSQHIFEPGVKPSVLFSDKNCTCLIPGTVPDKLLRICRHLEWHWKCRLRPLLFRFLGLILCVISILFVWSECTFFLQKPTLSIIALALQSQLNNPNFNLILLICFFTLGYLSFCVYFTVYRLRLFNYYRLVPNHHTEIRSLIFYAMLLCRLTPSLCLNFLCLAHLDSHVVVLKPYQQPINSNNLSPNNGTIKNVMETAFTKFMGHLDIVTFISSGFNIYFPMLVVLFCLCTYFRLGSRILQCLGIPMLLNTTNTQNDNNTQDNFYNEAIQDGKMILYRERIMSRAATGSRSRRKANSPSRVKRSTEYKNIAFQEENEFSEVKLNTSRQEEEETTALEYSEDHFSFFDFDRHLHNSYNAADKNH